MDSARAEAIVSAQSVVKAYGHGKTAVSVLNDLNLSVRPGEFIVILGPSGSGKSTLLNILGLMDSPNAGEILFAGQSARKMTQEQKSFLRNQKIGFVFQFDSLLKEFTVLENIMMPAKISASRRGAADSSESESRALELLARLGLKGISHRFPSQISGGERQRVALCRALINRAGVLLADEPTGNLDKHNGELVFKDLKALSVSEGAAVVMVTHNEAATVYADRVLRMKDGNIEEVAEKTT
jgi:ABC-type lipoprotein export system ATPase subunit